MSLFFISWITLLALSSLLLILVFLITGYIEWWWGILWWVVIVLIINIVWRLLGPMFSDRIYRYFYGVERISLESLQTKNHKTAELIQSICQKYAITLPKLWLIKDNNPSAFTYGSGKWNSRIIISEWILTYLDDEEVSSVFAHELWHVQHNDFIVMTVASVILQLIYLIYRYLIKVKSKWKKWWNLKIIALIAYVFYVIWQYVLLFLSRTREYYADKFAAEETDPNVLANALIKIALGILATPENSDLVRSTQHMNIANVKISQSLWLTCYNAKHFHENELFVKAIIYDLKNPRARLGELWSTHPLTWKRIRALMRLSQKPLYAIDQYLQAMPIDMNKMWRLFLQDCFVSYLHIILPLCLVWYAFYAKFSDLIFWQTNVLFWCIWLFGLGLLIKNMYMYSDNAWEPSTVLACLWDVYASPVRWKCVELQGEIIWQWIPWYIFSEDMMLKDSTWLLYIDYLSWIPLIWNLFFSLTKVKKLIGKKTVTTWWFFRWVYSYFTPAKLQFDGEVLNSYNKFYGFVLPVLFIICALLLFYVTKM